MPDRRFRCRIQPVKSPRQSRRRRKRTARNAELRKIKHLLRKRPVFKKALKYVLCQKINLFLFLPRHNLFLVISFDIRNKAPVVPHQKLAAFLPGKRLKKIVPPFVAKVGTLRTKLKPHFVVKRPDHGKKHIVDFRKQPRAVPQTVNQFFLERGIELPPLFRCEAAGSSLRHAAAAGSAHTNACRTSTCQIVAAISPGVTAARHFSHAAAAFSAHADSGIGPNRIRHFQFLPFAPFPAQQSSISPLFFRIFPPGRQPALIKTADRIAEMVRHYAAPGNRPQIKIIIGDNPVPLVIHSQFRKQPPVVKNALMADVLRRYRSIILAKAAMSVLADQTGIPKQKTAIQMSTQHCGRPFQNPRIKKFVPRIHKNHKVAAAKPEPFVHRVINPAVGFRYIARNPFFPAQKRRRTVAGTAVNHDAFVSAAITGQTVSERKFSIPDAIACKFAAVISPTAIACQIGSG